MRNRPDTQPISHPSTAPAMRSSIAKNPSTPARNTPASSARKRPIARMVPSGPKASRLPLQLRFRRLPPIESGHARGDAVMLPVPIRGHAPRDLLALGDRNRRQELPTRDIPASAASQVVPVRAQVVLREFRQQGE